MYGGHVGAALGGWSLRRSVPLWLPIVAAQLPDWMDAGLCVAGRSRGPLGLYSHGLVPVVVAATVLALAYLVWRRDAMGSVLLGALVLSHLPLDYVTGMKPTWPGGPVIGLSLYAHPAADIALETLVIVAGWSAYRARLPREVRDGGMVYASLALLLALQLAAGIAFFLQLGGHVKC